MIVNGWPVGCPLFNEITVLQGRKLAGGDERKIIIGRVLAANLGKKVGDKIELYGSEDFEIAGIYESPIVYENGGAMLYC